MKEIVFLPAEQRVLVLPDEKHENKTNSGIIIPNQLEEDKPFAGTVIAAGKGSIDNPMDYKTGDRVLFSSYAGVETPLNYKGVGRKEFKIMNQIDIMGKIVEE